MTATATATPETAAGETTTSDPLDSLDFSEVQDVGAETPIPDHMVLGGPEKPTEDNGPTDAEGSETGAMETTQPTTTVPAEPTLPEGYTKDARGRVHRPDGTLASKDEVAAFATAPQQQSTSEPRPFQYRAAGETKSPEGFHENADGSVTVKADKAGELRALFNARDVLQQSSAYVDGLKAQLQTAHQEVARYRQGSTVAEQRANALVDEYSKMLAEPDDAKAVEAFFLLRSNYPALLAKAEANHWKSVAQSGRPGARPKGRTPETPARESAAASTLPPRESALEATTEHVEALKLDAQFRDISADDWKQFSARCERSPYAYLRPATDAEAQKYGVHPGEVVFDTDSLIADVQQFASSLKTARETAAQQAKLAADNARKTAPSIDAPPVAGKGAAPAKPSKAFTSQQDVDAWWESPEL